MQKQNSSNSLPASIAPNGKVHPVAEMFPLMPDDELEELAADIKANGLINPIVLDREGTLIDGRNRLEACQRASVAPVYTLLDRQDPVAFILSSNVNRRHLNKGQQAMIAAKVKPLSFNDKPRATLAKELKVASGYIGQAELVLQYASDLSDGVLSGAMALNAAYEIAQTRKKEANSDESKMLRLRREAKDLAEQVTEERLTLKEAIAALSERERETERKEIEAKKLREIRANNWNTIFSMLGTGPCTSAQLAETALDYDPLTFEWICPNVTKELFTKCIETLSLIRDNWKE